MNHTLIEILVPWSIVLLVDLSVVCFFVRLANKNSSTVVDMDDNILYNQRNRKG
jgi:hypothetical protein